MRKKGSFARGENTLQITRGAGGKAFLTANCKMQRLVWANLHAWPESVTGGGKNVSLWLLDQSGCEGYKRLFEFGFFDENGAKEFFDVVVENLPRWAKKGQSFDELREASGSEADDFFTEELSSDEDDSDDKSSGATEDDIGSGRATGQSANVDEENYLIEGVDKDNYLIQGVVEADGAWGESQPW